ncbi:SDR family oxidoreductase [Thermoflexibacter ruber]|uniref:NAD(P)-dependent dehydrogenase, short-chain alcohol dehydrogenase family n=1 Tax=Thermoflexibacter ruber TaxID=1003 RepID=A0A1I2CVM9_9BACT|nr:SDR family oxidoreductase [Thermoflexibacter ruber]SFE71843.1 NAD(P)-dependent dehydrogenase, short-chain alcohol dehydrogenase family [Thermoflexibacter ruber]
MNLTDKVAVVLGGTGGVGEGIVKALLQAGAAVVVPTRSPHKTERLQEYVGKDLSGKLLIKIGTVTEEDSAKELASFLQKEFKQIDIGVASLGGWHQGFPIYSYPMEHWNRILNDNLTSHFLAIKTLIPLLNPQEGYYFHINGFSADESYPMAGPVAMTAAAQKSLIQTLAQEVNRTGIKVYELILGPMKTRDRLKHGHGQPNWYFPEEIGDYMIKEMQNGFQEKIIHYLLSKG